jgi:YjbE family integral membrane protein
VNDFATAAFWVAVPQIVLVNILLSGDNAVVIAMACRALPPRQRLWGVAIGAGMASLLLIVFAGIVTSLMALPYVKLVGGVLLIYVAIRLLVPEQSGKRAAEPAMQLWHAVRIIAIADVVMSLDNVIAVAAVARGNFALLAVALGVSIPIIVAGAALVTALLNRFPVFVWIGAALLGWIAGEVIAADPAVAGYLSTAFSEKFAGLEQIAAAGAGSVVVLGVGAMLRRN